MEKVEVLTLAFSPWLEDVSSRYQRSLRSLLEGVWGEPLDKVLVPRTPSTTPQVVHKESK